MTQIILLHNKDTSNIGEQWIKFLLLVKQVKTFFSSNLTPKNPKTNIFK